MLIANGLPQPYHPCFNVSNFSRLLGLFSLCIESADEKFEVEHTTAFMESLNAQEVTSVEK